MRHKPFSGCSGTFHSFSQHRKLTSRSFCLLQELEVGIKSAAALWTFPVTTTDHRSLLAPLIHKGWAAALDCCPQEMSCGGYCKIKSQTQNNFQEASCHRSIFLTPLKGKNPNKPYTSAAGQDAQQP